MPRTKTKRRIRAPNVTRSALLESAFSVIYRHGFQAAGLDDILKEAGVTKGALYHHFADKSELGYAVVNEIVKGPLLQRWLAPLERTDDPLSVLQAFLRDQATTDPRFELRLGCPLNNLAQEMSPLDERFRAAINAAFTAWRRGFTRALERGQAAGTVRRDVDARQVAAFLIAAIEGSYGLAKSAGSLSVLRSNLEMVVTFLDSLRPARTRRRRH
jgi:AcrR family transcriptional regulator